MKGVRARIDLMLLGAVVMLLVVGVFMVYSASLVVAYNEFHDDTYFLSRQIRWIVAGLIVMAVLARVDYRRWQRYSLGFLLVGILLLALVLIPGLGMRSYGSARWLQPVPFFQVQPSEFIKLAMVIYMADWLARKNKRVGEFFYCSLPFLVVLGVVCALVVAEPDFGTTVVIAATAVSIFLIAGANLIHFTPVVGLMISGFWFVMTRAGYRNQRIDAWFDPWQDSQGAGWHTIQTLIALGSGGVSGLGLGASRQKHSWLVNAHTDAIMAIVGEELGLLGTLAVLGLFGVVVWRGLRIAYRAPDTYGRVLAAGLTTMIFWQAAVNLAVVTNSAPYTGVTLPFVSFGGSSTVVSLAAIGLLLSVARHRSVPGHQRSAASGKKAAREGGGRRPREGSAAEPIRDSVGELEAPISLASARKQVGSRRRSRER